MGWKQTSDPNDIGYMENANGTYILEWHERAPGRKIIASGTFSSNYPFIATARHSGQPMIVRCPESKKALPLSDFEEKQLCRNCTHRTGNEPLYPIVQMSRYPVSIDLAGIICDDKYYSAADMLVPQGCPCSNAGTSLYPHRKTARTYHLNRESELVPKAWKLTFDGSRFRLSFHFRRIFISKNGKFANDGFFQHVIVDIDSGKTFVTDISDGTRHGGEHKARLVDDITYTGSTAYLSPRLSFDNLKTPLEALYCSVIAELRKRGLTDIVDDEYSEIDISTLSDIACINRFPGLSDNPFPDRWMLPDRMQRKVTSSPRDARVEKLMEHIGLDPHDEKLRDAITAMPSSLENIYILKEFGCDDRTALLEACSVEQSDDVQYFLRKFVSACTEYGFDGIDVLDLMLPKTGAANNWQKCVLEMATIGSEASRRSSTWMNTFAQNAVFAALHLSFPASNGLRDMVAKLNDVRNRYHVKNFGVCKDRDLKDRFQSSKMKWIVSALSEDEARKRLDADMYMPYRARVAYESLGVGNVVIVSFAAAAEPSEYLDIELYRNATLDRRKWRGKLKTAYRKGLIDGDKIPQDVVTATYAFGEVLSTPYEISMKANMSAEIFEKAIRKWCKKHFVKPPKDLFASLKW